MRRVKIRVKGRLDKHWSEWFDGLKISYRGEDETVLSGPFCDQAALYSLLTKLRDLGLGLVSLRTTEISPAGNNRGVEIKRAVTPPA
jgi:hypothetical protein